MSNHQRNQNSSLGFIALIKLCLLTSNIIAICLAPLCNSALVIENTHKLANQIATDPNDNTYHYGENNHRGTNGASEGSLSKSLPSDQAKSHQASNVLASRDYKRPIWNIAHMVNSIKELDYRLGLVHRASWFS